MIDQLQLSAKQSREHLHRESALTWKALRLIKFDVNQSTTLNKLEIKRQLEKEKNFTSF